MKLQGIQYLRFLAAGLVLLGHASMDGHQAGIIDDVIYRALDSVPWGSGVDVFFVISGFIICLITDKVPKSRAAAGQFLVNRLIRIVPIYWLYTFLMVAALLVANGREHLDLTHLGASLLMLPWLDGDGVPRPILGQGWTLNYEMYFYFVAALAMLTGVRRRALVLGATIACVTVALEIVPWESTAFTFYGNWIVLEFVFGILCYHLIRRATPVSFITKVIIGIFGLTLIATGGQIENLHRVISQGLPATLLVMAFALPARSAPLQLPWLAGLGDASYSLYLSHPFVTNVIATVGGKYLVSLWPLYVAISVIVAVCVSLLSYRLVERPLVDFLRRLADRGRQHVPPGASLATVEER